MARKVRSSLDQITFGLRWIKNKDLLWHALPILLIIFIVLFLPFRYRFEFDHDEGINAIKALLNLKGYSLYSDVWNDQPPLFTFMLAVWLRVFGINVVVGRVLVICFSATIIWLTIQYLRRYYGDLHSVLGVLLVMMLPYYLRLSVSIMIGLPSISLALLSFFGLTLWHKSGKLGWLIVSSFTLGLSIMTKLFTGILVPLFLAGILISGVISYRQNKDWFQAYKPSILWLVGLSLVCGFCILFVVKIENISQIIQVHLSAGSSEYFSTYLENRSARYLMFMQESWPIFVLALIGGISACFSREWTAVYLVGWVVIGSIFLYINTPFWYHHQLLVTVPSAILAAIAAGDAVQKGQNFLRSRKVSILGIILALVSIVFLALSFVTRIPNTLRELDFTFPNLGEISTEDFAEYEILASIWNYADETNWIYTDRPIFAFRAQLPVPPYLAVVSKKRLAAGGLSDNQILEILTEYKPEQIFQERTSLQAVQEYMSRRNYRRVDSSKKYRLYVREDLLNNPENNDDSNYE
jgi:4-amino-4-deoxy-L-arabinose transferase-like glycosyltransferase